MKKNLLLEIEIPEKVEINLENNLLIVKGPEGENKRKFVPGKINLDKKDKKILIECKEATKREKKIMNTIAAHIKNMIKGVQEKFSYKLKVCFNHFPMTVKAEENMITIKNFLGEKKDRKIELPNGVEISVEKDLITLTSINKELAGQASANLEQITKIKKKDRRVFQDGIFIINKSGKII